ncbi:hypothetical protein [Microbacterium sp. RU33B]|uniref:hypothetical protein n=1 Tax=Microbacterium sp. RU33B TaxID=1907390 RepID=UPI00095FCF5C|nr:hypothetical protein [Microbacterium sp. RU33B]SIT72548.1 hypothetical protein SAMN05880545_1071 [Microbacterium sp. RU33B]
MTAANLFRPVVAIEVTGLLGFRIPPNIDARLLSGTNAQITFRREHYPSRFVGEPVWDDYGQYVEHWLFRGTGPDWVRSLVARDVEVVWASRYQEHANRYFAPALDLPELPVAAVNDGRFHTTEAEWKASQLGRGAYAGRPLLWVDDELTTSGRHLLERERRPFMRTLTWSKYIPDSASDNDVQSMNEWLELASSSEGHLHLRQMRTRFEALRRRERFSTGQLHEEWVEIRRRLDDVVDFRSGLAAPLATYAIEHIGELDIRVVARIREEWGLPVDPAAEVLLPLLFPGGHPSP